MIDKLQLLEIATTNESSYFVNTSFYRVEWTGSTTRLTKLAPKLESKEQALKYYTLELNAKRINNEQFKDFMANDIRDNHWHASKLYPDLSSLGVTIDDMKAHGSLNYIDLETLEPLIKHTVLDDSLILKLEELIMKYWDMGYCFLLQG